MLIGIHALLVLGVLVVEFYCLVLGFNQSCAHYTGQYGLHSITLRFDYNGGFNLWFLYKLYLNVYTS
jgi:hypothetical protein